MKMRHKDSGKYLAMKPELVKEGADHPWVLVDSEAEATIDPGWIGEDYTMVMLSVLPRGQYEFV